MKNNFTKKFAGLEFCLIFDLSNKPKTKAMKTQLNMYTIYREVKGGLQVMGTYSGISQKDAIEYMAFKENLSREELYSRYVAIPLGVLERFEVPREQ